MTARVFRSALRVMHRTFSEQQSAAWIRSGEGGALAVDPVRVTFTARGVEVDVDGIKVSTGKPQASVLLSDALAIEPLRAVGKEEEIFRNDGRDKLVIDGRTYGIESCKGNGYGSLHLDLIG